KGLQRGHALSPLLVKIHSGSREAVSRPIIPAARVGRHAHATSGPFRRPRPHFVAVPTLPNGNPTLTSHETSPQSARLSASSASSPLLIYCGLASSAFLASFAPSASERDSVAEPLAELAVPPTRG